MRRRFGLIFFILILCVGAVFAAYVASTDKVCDRIERTTEIVKWLAGGIGFAVGPWVQPETNRMIHVEGVRLRLKFAGFLQAYNGFVVCPWDEALMQRQRSGGAQ